MSAEPVRPDPQRAEARQPDPVRVGQVHRVRSALRTATHPAVVALAVAGVVSMVTDTRWVDGLVAVGVALLLVRDGARPDPGREAPATGVVAAARGVVVRTPRWAALTACLLLAAAFAPFERYSVEVTVAVWAAAATVVVLTWPPPGTPPTAVPRRGALVWAWWAVAACLWELGALLGQPSLTEGSRTHPTVSVLLDPVLATSPGRALLLAGWLVAGWWLCERAVR